MRHQGLERGDASQSMLCRSYQRVPQSVTVLLSQLVAGNRRRNRRPCVCVYCGDEKFDARALSDDESASAAIQHAASDVSRSNASSLDST